MTSPKSFKRYAGAWLSLFFSFKDDPDKVRTMKCENANAAKALRLEFYKAREAALLDEGLKKELEEALNSREVKIKDNVVTFDSKDSNWIGKIIQASLEEEEKDGTP